MDQGRPILSISLLASNQKETVRRCLDSLRSLMEQVPSELIIVDTGLSPEVQALLREYTDCVIPFSWCNDFAKARNCGLTRARGEWFLYIDDDEWFENTEEIVRFFRSGEYLQYGYANYIQRNFLDPGYRTYTDNWVSRMVRLTKDVRFKSRIHEYFDPVYGTGKNIPAVANHSGYIHVTEQDRRKRYMRNVPLLQEMMDEEPDNLRWAIQLAQEYYSVEEWETLEVFCRSVLQNEHYQKQPVMKRLAATFYAGIVESLVERRQPEQAICEAERAYADEDCSLLGKAYLFLQEAICNLQQRDWKRVAFCLDQYEALEKEITADEAQYAIMQEALIVDGTFDMVNKKKATLMRFLCEAEQEHSSEALQLFAQLEWGTSVVYAYPPLMPILLETLVEHPGSAYMEQIWRIIWNNEPLYDMMIKESNRAWDSLEAAKKKKLRENYKRQVMAYLAVYYKQDALLAYVQCLPKQAQRALGMMDEIVAAGDFKRADVRERGEAR